MLNNYFGNIVDKFDYVFKEQKQKIENIELQNEKQLELLNNIVNRIEKLEKTYVSLNTIYTFHLGNTIYWI